MKKFLLPSLTILGATLLATTAVGGTYALLNASAAAGPGVTIQAGSAALSITSPLSMPGSALYPGARSAGTVAVRNDGTVPLALRLAGLTPPTVSNELAQSLVVGVRVVSSTGDCTAAGPAPTGTFASTQVADLGVTLAPQATAILCVSVLLPTKAPSGSQGQAVNFGLLIDGRQV